LTPKGARVQGSKGINKRGEGEGEGEGEGRGVERRGWEGKRGSGYAESRNLRMLSVLEISECADFL
jgi:hypothetical protein